MLKKWIELGIIVDLSGDYIIGWKPDVALIEIR